MEDKDRPAKPEIPTATDAEVASAARRLGLGTIGSAAPSSKSKSGQVVQRLAHGRMHAVAVEVKPSRR